MIKHKNLVLVVHMMQVVINWTCKFI